MTASTTQQQPAAAASAAPDAAAADAGAAGAADATERDVRVQQLEKEVAASAARVTHVLFDMDGLLLDTETSYTIAQQQICAELGREFTWAVKAQMMGLKAPDAAAAFVRALDLEGQLTPEEFLRKREALLPALFAAAPAMPGAEPLVMHLRANNVPIAVATSSHRRNFEIKTKNHAALFAHFGHVVTGDDVTHSKPHPEIFQAAAAKFTPPPARPQDVLVFEDAPAGVQAALAAGMRCVFVPDPNLDKAVVAELEEQGRAAGGRVVVCASLLEVLPLLATRWGLPAYDGGGGGS